MPDVEMVKVFSHAVQKYVKTRSSDEARIAEADRLGFKEIYISKYNAKGLDTKKFSIRINWVGKVEDLKRALFV